MTRLWWILSLLILSLLVGCNTGGGLGDDDDSATDDDDAADDDDDATDDDDDDDATDDDDDDDSVALAAVVAVYPQDGATDHYIGAALRVDFDLPAEDAVLVLVNDENGETISGDSVWLTDTRLRFKPTVLLAPMSNFSATATWGAGAGTHSWSFATNDLGTVLVDSDMTGNTYSMAVADGTVVSPAGAEDLLSQFDAVFLLGVVAQTATELELHGSTSEEGSDPLTQNLCVATFDLSEKVPTVWTDPYFSGGPTDIAQTLDIPNLGPFEVNMRDVEMTGVFTSSDGVVVDGITAGTFSAYVDTQELGLDCSLLSGFIPGLACSECPGRPGVDQCVVFDVTDIPGALLPSTTLVVRTDEDIEADPNCD